MSVADEPALVVFLRLYRRDPCLFVQEVLGAIPDPAQADVLNAVASGERRISVRSGHGVGKSTVASWLMIWFLITKFPSKTVVTAPTTAQLFDALFAELKRWLGKLPLPLQELLEVKAERIELKAAPAEGFITARTSRAEQPEALQGVHSEHVLLIADEASGVPESVFEAASGSMSGHHAVTLLLGNPVRSSGFFYDTHNKLSPHWKTFVVPCHASPRVSKEYIEEMATRYGVDSNAYRIRVLGEFPRADDDTLIPMELIELATTRDVLPVAGAPLVWGLDIARYGPDSTVLLQRRGNAVTSITRWSRTDTMETVGRVKLAWDTLLPGERPEEILADVIGIGAGVVDRLRGLRLAVRGVNVGEAPSIKGGHHNLRAELWTEMKAWFERRDCRIPANDYLISELAACKFHITSCGKIQIESKDDARRRGLPSPDTADALMLTFAATAATAIHGWSHTSPWAKPLKRNQLGIV